LRESKVEKALSKRVKSLGGICEKFSPGSYGAYGRGRPDRIVTLPGGRIIFVELKRPDKGELTPLQIRDHATRKGLGCDVRVINNVQDAMAFPDEDLLGDLERLLCD
jgi:hypothetical protein